MGSNSAPGFAKHPGHRIATRPAGVRVRVLWRGEPLADTREAILMEEAMEGSTVAPAVYYIPRRDVRIDRFERTAHASYCPFKGQASYYSLAGGPENVAWSYEAPYDEMLAIKGALAFYPDRVDAIEVLA